MSFLLSSGSSVMIRLLCIFPLKNVMGTVLFVGDNAMIFFSVFAVLIGLLLKVSIMSPLSKPAVFAGEGIMICVTSTPF